MPLEMLLQQQNGEAPKEKVGVSSGDDRIIRVGCPGRRPGCHKKEQAALGRKPGCQQSDGQLERSRQPKGTDGMHILGTGWRLMNSQRNTCPLR
ncbi:hypothetical protein ACLOJK_007976 [Asimina triloba]